MMYADFPDGGGGGWEPVERDESGLIRALTFAIPASLALWLLALSFVVPELYSFHFLGAAKILAGISGAILLHLYVNGEHL